MSDGKNTQSKDMKMQGAALEKAKQDGRGVISPTVPPSTVDDDEPGPFVPEAQGLRPVGSNFFLLAAVGVGAYFFFKNK